MSEFYNNSIFWVEVERIRPNPYQPRKEFNDAKIVELADSIRQYGVLQPLVVTRNETERSDGGIGVDYELIAGERRLRASKIAGLAQVPVIIRAKGETNKMKLELAIIENLQREDLNAIDRAMAFKQLVHEFSMKHIEVAKKVGKSREYVSNTLRLLGLPENIQQAIISRRISEGHARPLLMLGDRPAERDTLFKEIQEQKLTVRETERIARRIAVEKQRKPDLSKELMDIEKKLTDTLGTRVQIEKRAKKGGKLHIDYFSEDDLHRLLKLLDSAPDIKKHSPVNKVGESKKIAQKTQNFQIAQPPITQNNTESNKQSLPKQDITYKQIPHSPKENVATAQATQKEKTPVQSVQEQVIGTTVGEPKNNFFIPPVPSIKEDNHIAPKALSKVINSNPIQDKDSGISLFNNNFSTSQDETLRQTDDTIQDIAIDDEDLFTNNIKQALGDIDNDNQFTPKQYTADVPDADNLIRDPFAEINPFVNVLEDADMPANTVFEEGHNVLNSQQNNPAQENTLSMNPFPQVPQEKQQAIPDIHKDINNFTVAQEQTREPYPATHHVQNMHQPIHQPLTPAAVVPEKHNDPYTDFII
jgi:ParB family chromosome partitioning protein